jgi:putative acetyltransferase
MSLLLDVFSAILIAKITMAELIHPNSPQLWTIARDLVREYAASLNVNLDFQNFDEELLHFETEYAPPTGTFLLARHYDEFVACGALRRFSDSDCEMKRLYVRPVGRNLGIGRQIGQALISEAKSLGYKHMLLDTLPAMKTAQSLYKSLGFQPIEPYRFNPIHGSSFLKLDL